MNTAKFAASFGVAVFTATASVASDVFTYDADDPRDSYGDGKIRMTYGGDGDVTAIEVDPEGGEVILQGDAISLSAAAIYIVSKGRFILNNDFGSEGASLAVYGYTNDVGTVAGEISTYVGEGVYTEDGKTYRYIEGNREDVAYEGSKWRTALTGVRISDIAGITAHFNGPQIADADAYMVALSNSADRTFAAYQLHLHASPWIKSVDLHLRENGDKIEVRTSLPCYARYDLVEEAAAAQGVDPMDYVIRSTAHAKSLGGGKVEYYHLYAVESVTFTTADRPERFVTETVLAGINRSTGGRIDVMGATALNMVTAGNKFSVSANAAVNVHSNAVFRIAADLSGGDAGARYLVHPGGRLRQDSCNYLFTAWDVTVTNDAGVVHLNADEDYNSYREGKSYLSSVALKDGAVLKGFYPPRVGYYPSRWTVIGDRPSYNECGFVLVGKDGAASPAFTIETEADFYIGGRIADYRSVGYTTSVLTNCVIVKTGPATVYQSAVYDSPMPVRICQGTWTVAASNALDAADAIQLEGGTFAVADGLDVTVRELRMAADSSLSLSDGASLSIAEVPTDAVWPAGVRLDVSYPEGAKPLFRVGTSKCLDDVRLSVVRMNGKSVRQDETGRIVPVGGTVIVVR